MMTLKNILVPFDFSECSSQALRYGLEFARKFDATLHLVHVVQDPATQPWAAEGFAIPLLEVTDEWLKEAEARLEAAIPDLDRGRVHTAALLGAIYPEVLRYAQDEEIDLIVMGTHGRGFVGHVVMGSVAEKVVRTAPCPVLTVRNPNQGFVAPDVVTVSTAASA